MLAGPRALVDHSALRKNLAVVRRYAPRSRIWAVIKANAYGHGMEEAAAALDGADGFALARVEEAVRLREAGVGKPLLILEGAAFPDELEYAGRHGLELVLHQEEQVALLERVPASRPLRIWIKVDTGMRRLGFLPEVVPGLIARLSGNSRLANPPALMTHLANADDPQDGLTSLQCRRLKALLPGGRGILSIGNSAGVLAHPEARTEWVRPGIMLYGASPLINRSARELGLSPVMTLASRIIAVRALRRGDAIGYGGTYVCEQDMPVGVVAVGYGDGYPRHAPSGTPVLIRGRRVPIVGRVSMDMISVDLRPVPDAALGDSVILWGQGLPVDEIAAGAGTIAYELFCGVTTRVRLDHLVAAPLAAQAS